MAVTSQFGALLMVKFGYFGILMPQYFGDDCVCVCVVGGGVSNWTGVLDWCHTVTLCVWPAIFAKNKYQTVALYY